MRGKKVAILESRLGAQLADLVAQRGGVPFHAPALAELPDLDPAAIGALLRSLEERPAKAAGIPTCRWSLAAAPRPLAELIGALERGEMDAAVFTNAEQVRNLFAVAGQLGRAEALRAALNRTLVASIGPVASAALREAKVKVGLESSPPKLGALLSALDSALS